MAIGLLRLPSRSVPSAARFSHLLTVSSCPVV